MKGWIWCGVSRGGAGFHTWQCARCGIRRQCVAMRDDWKCQVCIKRGNETP